MRSFRSTFVFIFIVLLVVLWSALDYRSKEKTEKNKEIQSQIFSDFEEKEKIRSIEFSGTNSFSLEKIQDKWHLTLPFKDLASKGKVEGYLEDLIKKKQKILIHDHKNEEEKILWADYGLEKPEFVFSIKQSLGGAQLKEQESKKSAKKKKKRKKGEKRESIKVSLSSIKSYDGKYFLRIDSQEELAVAEDDWSNVTSLEAENFREKLFFDRDLTSIDSFHFRRGKKEWEFKKEDNRWVYVQKPSLVIDESYVRSFIEKIQKLESDHFLSEPTTEELRKKYRLKNPMFEVTFIGERASQFDQSDKEALDGDLKNKDLEKDLNQKKDSLYQWTLELSAQKEKTLYVKASHRDYIGKVAEDKINHFPKELSSFRDKNHAFSFDQKKAFSFNLKSTKKTLHFKKILTSNEKENVSKESKNIKSKKKKSSGKEGEKKIPSSNWVIKDEESSRLSVKEDSLNSFLRQISNLEVDEFLGSKFKNLNLKNNLLLEDKEGNVLLRLDWGKRFSRENKKGLKKELYYFVKTNKTEEIVLLKRKKLDEILDIHLTEEKNVEEPKEALKKEDKKSKAQ